MKERPSLREFYKARRDGVLRQGCRIRSCTMLGSDRRGGPMCPPVVGIPNSPKTGREPHGVSAGRTHGPAPGRRFPPYFTILMPSMVQGGYDTATLKGAGLCTPLAFCRLRALFGVALQSRKNRQNQIFWAGQVDSNEVPAVVIAVVHPHACWELLQEPVQQCVCPPGRLWRGSLPLCRDWEPASRCPGESRSKWRSALLLWPLHIRLIQKLSHLLWG